jgi:Ribbon-helix-helix protein, copG family
MRYQQVEVPMSDVLIRDVPDDVLAALDQLAARVGLSRTEYIRRRLAQDARTAKIAVTTDDWRKFSDTHSDLADPAVMDQAWQ